MFIIDYQEQGWSRSRSSVETVQEQGRSRAGSGQEQEQSESRAGARQEQEPGRSRSPIIAQYKISSMFGVKHKIERFHHWSVLVSWSGW